MMRQWKGIYINRKVITRDVCVPAKRSGNGCNSTAIRIHHNLNSKELKDWIELSWIKRELLLYDSDLKKEMRREALDRSVYLANRSLLQNILKITPFEMWEKKQTKFKEFEILWTLMQKFFEEAVWTKEAKIISLCASSGYRLWDERRKKSNSNRRCKI